MVKQEVFALPQFSLTMYLEECGRMALPLRAILPLVAAVAAVVVAVAHPHVGHALVVGALEVVLGTLLGRAVPLVLAAGAVHLVVAPLLQGDAKTTCE